MNGKRAKKDRKPIPSGAAFTPRSTRRNLPHSPNCGVHFGRVAAMKPEPSRKKATTTYQERDRDAG